MYFDYYRDTEENKEFDDIYDNPTEIYEIEISDLPTECPYRQFTPPGFFPGMPSFPGGGHQGQGAPSSPPPNFAPPKGQSKSLTSSQGSKGIGVQAVDPGALRPCTFRFVYIWLRNRNSFWAYLTFVGRNSASGFRYNGRRWVYFGIDLRRIESFYCY